MEDTNKNTEKLKSSWFKPHYVKWAILSVVGTIIVFGVIGPLFVVLNTRNHVYSEADINQLQGKDVAIVFGAGVEPDRTPTPFLQARLETAVELYKQGKVKKLLLSGDNRAENYNEPFVMRAEVVKLGVPEADTVADYAGLGTYDSCYRAKHIFEVKSAYIVTQGYHAPRAVYTCRKLGIDASGVGTSRYWDKYGRLVYPNYALREAVSTNKALFEIHLMKSKASILGNPEPL